MLTKNLKIIKGDASFRKFYRKKNKNFSSIIVFAKKEKTKNLLKYDAINKLLIKNDYLLNNMLKKGMFFCGNSPSIGTVSALQKILFF